MSTLAERLKEALAERSGATQADLARACGIRAPSVHDWFTGKTKSLRATTLIKAASFLGVRPLWLAEGKGPKHDRQLSIAAVEPSAARATALSSWPFSVPYAVFDSLTPEHKAVVDASVSALVSSLAPMKRATGS